jgi:hypothetical protein
VKYFKLTSASGSQIEYLKVKDDAAEVKAKLETTLVEEISEETFEAETNPRTSRWDLFMPTT